MTIYYLYKKTHQKTGLNYLGYTQRNPYEYSGSGSYWIAHLKKHGYKIDTEVLLETESKDQIKSVGKYYSDLWNIVEAKDATGKKTWANLKPEEGVGGSIPRTKPYPESARKILSQKLKGRVYGSYSPEHGANVSRAKQGHKKGLTYDEIYGKKTATKLRKDRSIKLKRYLNEHPGIRAGNKNNNAKLWEFISPDGKHHIINGTMAAFCKEHDLKLHGAYKCVNGELDTYKGWKIKKLSV